jgi:sulfite exporter TauE/SafE
LGFIFAGIIQGLALRLPVAQFGFWMRTILGIILIFLGFKIILNKSTLPAFFSNNLIWSRAKKLLHKITQGNSGLENLLKGMLWGLIPCGLLYGVLIAAATTQDVIQGGLFMFAFGLGTLPAMFVATGMMKLWQQHIQSQYLRYGAGLFLIIIGLWSIVSVWFSHELIPNHPVFTSIVAFLDSCVP